MYTETKFNISFELTVLSVKINATITSLLGNKVYLHVMKAVIHIIKKTTQNMPQQCSCLRSCVVNAGDEAQNTLICLYVFPAIMAITTEKSANKICEMS